MDPHRGQGDLTIALGTALLGISLFVYLRREGCRPRLA